MSGLSLDSISRSSDSVALWEPSRDVRRTKRGKMGVVFGLAAACLLSGCRQRQASTDTEIEVLRISQRNEPGDLDPATATLPD
jgi:hypothetical protein